MDDSHAGGISPTVSPKLRRCASSSIVELQKRREEIASFDADRVTTSKELQQASAKLGELTSRTNPLYTTQNGQSGPHTQEPLQSAVWKTGIWTRLPVFAALSLLGVLACEDVLEKQRARLGSNVSVNRHRRRCRDLGGQRRRKCARLGECDSIGVPRHTVSHCEQPAKFRTLARLGRSVLADGLELLLGT